MSEEPKQRYSIWGTLRKYVPRAFPYLRPYRKLFAVTVGITLVTVVLSLAQPWPLALLVDGVLSGQPLPGWVTSLLGTETGRLIGFAVSAGFLLTITNAAINVLDSYVQSRLEQSMVLDFRSDLFQHVQGLSLRYHEGVKQGGLMFAINMQASAMGEIILSLLPLVHAALTLVGMLYVAYRLEPTLALVAVAVVPFVHYAIGFYGNRIEPELMHVRNLEGTSLSIVHEAMSMIRVVMAFGREPHEHRRFRTQGEETVDARVKVTVKQTGFSLAVGLITAAGTAGVLAVGARYVVSGRLTVGELLVILAYIAAVYQPLEEISGSLAGLQERLIALEAAVNLLDTAPDIEDPRHGVVIDRARGNVVFEGVAFAHEGRKRTLDDISFEASPGEVIALVGPTGAGKSTLVSLIPRFIDVQSGRILLDGHDLRDIKIESLRRQVSVVLQDPLLFSGSIMENIRYGRLDASDEDVILAAKSANAHEFVSGLPRGYDTVLGEGGARLSGGERQRLSIARAFLKDAPLIILDEPTSSIDSKTEAVILDALSELVEGRTTFMIAHRLATIRHADRILVIQDGRIVEQGTHEQLLKANGHYREMWDVQTGSRRRPRVPRTSAVPTQPTAKPRPSSTLSGTSNAATPRMDYYVTASSRDQAITKRLPPAHPQSWSTPWPGSGQQQLPPICGSEDRSV